MIKIKSRKARLTTFFGIAILSFGILFFLLRGPYLSNSIKRIIIPVLENATRERVIIDKAVINLIPFYFQTRRLKVFDKDGNKLLRIAKIRAYIDFLGLLSKEVRIRKLIVNDPILTADKQELDEVIHNVQEYLSKGGNGQFRVTLRNTKMTDGEFTFNDTEELISISGRGLFLDMVSKDTTATINVLLKNGVLKLPNDSELSGGFNGKIKVESQKIKVSEINIHSSKSTLQAKGVMILSSGGKVKDGSFTGNAKVFAETLNRIFDLKQEKESVLTFDGSVDLVANKDSKWPKFELDLETDSQFYLETLMEILRVDENITGRAALKGKITGTLPDLQGIGTVKLEDAVLDTLPLDDVEGDLAYRDQEFTLNNFTAHTYNGELKGDAHILIPHGDYSVTASVSDINSPKFFQFIKWEPPFPAGKIEGKFQLDREHGSDIEVVADVNYLNTSKHEGDVLSRLKSIHAALELRDGILNLHDSILSTSNSDLVLNGDIDLNEDTLDLDMQLESTDIADLTTPYYMKFIAPVRFKGKAKGLTRDPEISGRLEADSGSIHGIQFINAFADLKYKINALSVDQLKINQDKANYDVSGSIEFREAKGLFSFKDPHYKAEVMVKNTDIKPFVTVIYKDIPVSGRVNGLLSFEGDSRDFIGTGDLIVSDSDVYGQQLDKVIIKTVLHPKNIEFPSVTAFKGESGLAAKGKLFFNKKFNVSVSSNNLVLSDIDILRNYPFDASLSLDINGSGKIDNPALEFSVNVLESNFKDVKIGTGEIKGRLKNKDLLASGSFVNGIVTADARVTFSDKTLWTVDVDFKKGRYDFILSGFLKKSPRDLTASLKGKVRLQGQGNNVSMQSKFDSVTLGLYGYNFRNDEDIDIELEDNEFSIKSFSLTGNNADLFAAGSLKINENYNLTMRGNLDIAPLRVLTDKLESLKGRGNFTVDITGPWENPEIIGEIDVKNATATIAEFPYKVGPVNGTFFLKKGRITFDSLNTIFAGGNVVMSGVGYLEKLSLKRLFISSDINNIKIRPVEGVSSTLDGRLFYEVSSKGQSLTGNIDVKKARYEKRVEWKSWLLGLKEIKASPAGYPEFLAETELNLRITGSDNISIDNNIARTPVKIALNVTGTVLQYGLIGRIEANKGSIYFRGNEFKILKGSNVDFISTNTITPVLHILAETYASDYYIRLSLDGTIDNFSLTLFSDPPLTETEILSLLTFGQINKEAKGIESGIAASEATALLTGSIQAEVEKEFQNITGFDRIEIEPHTTTEGAFTPKVTVGKRLLEDRIFVTFSSALGTAEEQIINIEYKLNENLSLVGSRNEIGSAGADIKYRFEFK